MKAAIRLFVLVAFVVELFFAGAASLYGAIGRRTVELDAMADRVRLQVAEVCSLCAVLLLLSDALPE